MQNNTISCCIVVMLCILASLITGLIGVAARVVPSITVTGVLYLTAGIFALFGNSIEHEKISRMSRKPRTCTDCTCYSLVKTPEEYCSSAYRTVSAGWSLIPSWAAAVSFLIASTFWLCLSRSVRIEKSKSML
uniref:Inner membrane protein n=1 Tax=Macrostomum lignano TaxID=282301 RepID=A0A1I8HBS4_9PLAT